MEVATTFIKSFSRGSEAARDASIWITGSAFGFAGGLLGAEVLRVGGGVVDGGRAKPEAVSPETPVSFSCLIFFGGGSCTCGGSGGLFVGMLGCGEGTMGGVKKGGC